MPTDIANKKNAKVRWISQREMESLFEKRARAVLNISSAEFVRDRESGKYAKLDSNDCPGIVELALLAPTSKVATARARKKR